MNSLESECIARIRSWGGAALQTGTLHRTLCRVAPTAFAIVPVSALFGALAARADWSWLEILAVGALGFSGSGQFALLPLAETDAGFFTMLMVTASINSRYLPIAYASAGRLPTSLTQRAVVAHMLGDEAYATEQESDSRRAVMLIRGTIFGAWVGAGLLGAVLGQFIPAAWIGEGINLGFPASVVLMHLSASQLRARLWQVPGISRTRGLAAVGLCAGVSLLLISLLGPLYFWIPSVLAATVILGRTEL